MTEATYVQDPDSLDYTPTVDTRAGKVVLLPSLLVGVVGSGLLAGVLGATLTEGIFDVSSASATLFDDGAPVYWDDTNKLAVTPGTATATFRMGRAIGAKVSGSLVVRVEINALSGINLRTVATADSAAVSNTIVETIIGSFTIPANTLKVGSTVEFYAGIIAAATNSTDTFRGRVRIGGIAGAVVADTTAIDLANGDMGVMQGQVVVRATGITGSIAAASLAMLKATSNPLVIGATPIDTTAAITLVVTMIESAASAGNSAVASVFTANVR